MSEEERNKGLREAEKQATETCIQVEMAVQAVAPALRELCKVLQVAIERESDAWTEVAKRTNELNQSG